MLSPVVARRLRRALDASAERGRSRRVARLKVERNPADEYIYDVRPAHPRRNVQHGAARPGIADVGRHAELEQGVHRVRPGLPGGLDQRPGVITAETRDDVRTL